MDHISKSILRYRTFLINRHEIISCYCSFTSSVLARFNSTGRNSFLIYWCGFTAKFWNFEIFLIFSGKIHWLNRFFRTLSPKCSTKWQIWAKYLNYAPLQYLCYYTHSFFLMWGWSVWMFFGVISLLREIHFTFEILRIWKFWEIWSFFAVCVQKLDWVLEPNAVTTFLGTFGSNWTKGDQLMMNFSCGMVDLGKAFRLISRVDHSQTLFIVNFRHLVSRMTRIGSVRLPPLSVIQI